MRGLSARHCRRVLGLGVAAVLVAGCGSGQANPGGPAGTAAANPTAGFTVGMVSVTNCGNPTICAVTQGFRAEVEARGGRAVVLEWDGQGSPVDAAIREMDQLIAQRVNAIALWPVDANALKAPTERAYRAGIPVVAFDDFAVDTQGVVALVTQGRALQAQQAAQVFCDRLPRGSTVLYGGYALPIPSLEFLAKQFSASLAACSAGSITIAQTYLNKTDDVAGALTSARPALQANPAVRGIASYNDPTSIGGAQAAIALGARDKLLVLGYNTAPDGVAALSDGRLDYSWDYQPVVGGQILARTAVDYVTGTQKAPPKVAVVWPRCYNRATIAKRPSWDDQVRSVRKGTDLGGTVGAFVTTGDAVPPPPADLPGCPA